MLGRWWVFITGYMAYDPGVLVLVVLVVLILLSLVLVVLVLVVVVVVGIYDFLLHFGLEAQVHFWSVADTSMSVVSYCI